MSALGLPHFVPMAKQFNAQYRFHDAKLSGSVMAARHAIAIDEYRKTFPAYPWENVALSNEERQREWEEAHGSAEGFRPTIHQQWFPGDHGSIGGGGIRIGLSSIALHWIAMGAEEAGLRLSWEEVDRVAWRFDVDEALTNKFGPVGPAGMLLNMVKDRRDGPRELQDVALATLDRVDRDAGYRPEQLNFVLDDMLGKPAEEMQALRKRMIERDGRPTHETDSHLRPRPDP